MSDFQLKISTDDLKPYSLFVAMPTYGGQMSTITANSLISLGIACATYGINARFEFVTNESLIPRARNYLAEKFLQSEMTHMIFIDADIKFDPMSVLIMLGIQTQYPENYDVLAAPYTKKTIDWGKISYYNEMVEDKSKLEYLGGDFVFSYVEENQKMTLSEPFEVKEAGTGFMLIPKKVLTDFSEQYNMLKYKPDHKNDPIFNGSKMITAYFHCEIDENLRYLSEDYYFCHKIRDIGKKVHMVPFIELIHNGSYDYKGSLLKEFEAVNESKNKSK